MAKEKKNWIDEMIEREALPKASREESIEDFCSKWKIGISTYYYQSSKSENWKKILKIALMSAKKEVPEVLQVLGSKAKDGDMKAVDMYLNYVVQLSKNLDIKSDGEKILGINYIKPDGRDNNSANPKATPSIPGSSE